MHTFSASLSITVGLALLGSCHGAGFESPSGQNVIGERMVCAPVKQGDHKGIDEAQATLRAAGFLGNDPASYCVEIVENCEDCRGASDVLVIFHPKRGDNWSGAIVSRSNAHQPRIKIAQ